MWSLFTLWFCKISLFRKVFLYFTFDFVKLWPLILSGIFFFWSSCANIFKLFVRRSFYCLLERSYYFLNFLLEYFLTLITTKLFLVNWFYRNISNFDAILGRLNLVGCTRKHCSILNNMYFSDAIIKVFLKFYFIHPVQVPRRDSCASVLFVAYCSSVSVVWWYGYRDYICFWKQKAGA